MQERHGLVSSCAFPTGAWPTTEPWALTGNRTSDPLVLRLSFNPLSHTSQGQLSLYFPIFHLSTYLPIYLSIHLCIYLSVCLATYLSVSVYPSFMGRLRMAQGLLREHNRENPETEETGGEKGLGLKVLLHWSLVL